MIEMWEVWIACAVIFLIIEAVTTGLASIWFTVGALFAVAVSFFTDSQFIQFFVFVIVSFSFLIYTKYFYDKNLKKDLPVEEAHEKFLGKRALVIEDIPSKERFGKVVINGVTWKAISITNEPIKKDSVVIIKEIDGLTFKVILLEENNL